MKKVHGYVVFEQGHEKLIKTNIDVAYTLEQGETLPDGAVLVHPRHVVEVAPYGVIPLGGPAYRYNEETDTLEEIKLPKPAMDYTGKSVRVKTPTATITVWDGFKPNICFASAVNYELTARKCAVLLACLGVLGINTASGIETVGELFDAVMDRMMEH